MSLKAKIIGDTVVFDSDKFIAAIINHPDFVVFVRRIEHKIDSLAENQKSTSDVISDLAKNTYDQLSELYSIQKTYEGDVNDLFQILINNAKQKTVKHLIFLLFILLGVVSIDIILHLI